MISFEEIDKKLLNAKSLNVDDDFVAAAVVLDDEKGYAKHSGLVIHYNSGFYFLHYNASDVEILEFSTGNFYIKKLEFISEGEVEAFYVYCLRIKEHARPNYGYFFTGDYYDLNGKYLSESGIEEYMTCVGFCIKVIRGFIEASEYYNYEDWTESSAPSKFFNRFLEELKAKNPSKPIQEDLFRKHLRRITPAEYTAGAFLEIPVRKIKVDEIIENVTNVLLKKHQTDRS